ncbi:MAG: hypothetical protein BWX63_01792 [Bacteroidetes bacterium ADurb.Bin041]|nr:MAG: hypothetical protein BWX63_01792 [Bacteroidetes bacterium ADurb.Bin041]
MVSFLFFIRQNNLETAIYLLDLISVLFCIEVDIRNCRALLLTASSKLSLCTIRSEDLDSNFLWLVTYLFYQQIDT